jgi:hypothetical protein
MSDAEGFARTLGQLIRGYCQTLVSTTSAHTLVPRFSFPLVDVEHAEGGKVATAAIVEDAVETPEILQLRDAMDAIEAITGLPKVRIAELIGVSRVTYDNWRRGKNIAVDNFQRVLGTLDVLRRASARFRDTQQIQCWLYTAVGSRARTPAQLLGTGQVNQARMLAVTSLPARPRSVPDWLWNAPEDQWTARERRRKDRVVLESADSLGADADRGGEE